MSVLGSQVFGQALMESCVSCLGVSLNKYDFFQLTLVMLFSLDFPPDNSLFFC